MTTCLHSEHPSIWLGLFCAVLWAPFAYPIDAVHAQAPDLQVLETRICNVNGEVSIRSLTQGIEFAKVTLQDSVASGDRIETAKNSMVSMLVGEDAVVNIDQLSEVTIEQTKQFPKVIHVLRGTTSISTKNHNTHTNENVPIKTLASMIYPSPGTMFRVTVVEKDIAQSRTNQQPQAIFTTSTNQNPLFVQGRTKPIAREIIETIEVTHGSVEIVPQNTDISPMTVGEQFQVDITNGKLGGPVQGSGTQYDIQNMQIVPQHTANPTPIRSLIADNQSRGATGLVAALFTPENAAESALSNPNEGNVILPTTGSGTIVPNPREPIVQFEGPNPNEVNESVLEFNNNEVVPEGPDANVVLVSVSSGGLLRTTSTNPVISVVDSQITTQGGVDILDTSALEASAPLFAVLSSNNPNTTASQITTSGDTVLIAGGQLTAGLPADALGLFQLDAAGLTSAGALFDVSGGGFLAVNGNLVSLINGSELNVGSLVTLSGGSNFGLFGGSLLAGDNSSIANVNNTLCAGGGCQGGFVFAPPGNTVNIGQNFQPTQNVNVSPDAALIVVNGTGNTVNLSQ
ncbi:MAG: hypothetical protein ACPGYT_02885 [Nitrospirales bacterium]